MKEVSGSRTRRVEESKLGTSRYMVISSRCKYLPSSGDPTICKAKSFNVTVAVAATSTDVLVETVVVEVEVVVNGVATVVVVAP